MLTGRELTIDDYLGMLRRRWWLILIPAIIGPAVAYMYSLRIPNRYTSQTTVLVETQKVPGDFVRPVVTQDVAERLNNMQEQILSRTRLQPIIERFNLFRENGPASMEDLVGRMRGAVYVEPIRSERPGSVSGFTISFTYDNPRIAQQVCGEITSMFMEENLRSREQSAQGTTEFLRKQLDEAKSKLDEQDARMAEFQRHYIGQLPGQEQMNFNILNGLTQQQDGINQVLLRLQQDKTYTEGLLSQQITSWKASQSANNPLTLEQQLAKLEDHLAGLEARYTSKHPDVLKTKHDIDLVKVKIDKAQKEPKKDNKADEVLGTIDEPGEIQNLRRQIRQYELSIADKTHEQQRIQQQIGLYQSRVQLSPGIGEEYKQITRNYQIALDTYNDLLRKKTQSEIATDLERRQQGEQFRVMDPPNLPIKPSYPDRQQLAMIGLGIGIVLGAGISLLLEFRDRSIRSERDIEFFLQLPTLAAMPWVVQHDNGNGLVPVNGHGKKAFWQRFRRKQSRDREAIGA